MPVVSRFLGIVLVMYYRDHDPAHFHARYGEYETTVSLEEGVITGRFSRSALELVLEWYNLRKGELEANWRRARESRPLLPILPLEWG